MRVLDVDSLHPDPRAIDEAVKVLRGGGLVAFPTETVYGLGARAFDVAAVARIFEAKGRPPTHPLIAHVLGEREGSALARTWSARASRLAREFWPGPLTLVVDRAPRVPAAVAGGGDSLAIRSPAHPVARALLAALGEPIAAPSANRFQSISPTLAEHVRESLGDGVALILDGGACAAGIESTVLDVRREPACVLRPGALDLESLRRVVPEVARGPSADVKTERPSPGMDARHYAPRATLLILPDRRSALDVASSRARAGERVGVILCANEAPPRTETPALRICVLSDDPKKYAHDLFATLHSLDLASVDVVIVEAVPKDEVWFAIADRLERASARA